MTTMEKRNPWNRLPDGPLIAPSLLSVDFARAAGQIDQVMAAEADLLHVDVMDGHFVPNLSMGPAVVEKLRRYTDAVLDVHLMVTDPEFFFEPFAKAGADILNFHIEACGVYGTNRSAEACRLAEKIRQMGLGVGVTIKPQTPAVALTEVIPLVDMVLIMTVEPGFGGQSFMEDQLDKIREIRGMLKSGQRLQVDGGINPQTTRQCFQAGADVFVAGNNVFAAADPAEATRQLRLAMVG